MTTPRSWAAGAAILLAGALAGVGGTLAIIGSTGPEHMRGMPMNHAGMGQMTQMMGAGMMGGALDAEWHIGHHAGQP
jgi:hypothetical protein